MSTTLFCPNSASFHLPCIRKVGQRAPMAWLRAGLDDFKASWLETLPLGVILGIIGLVLVDLASDRVYLSVALAGGFLLLAPAIAGSVYQASRRLESEDAPHAGRFALGSHAVLFGLLLAMIFAVWVDLAVIMTAYLTPRSGFTMDGAFNLVDLLAADNLAFLAAYLVLGAAFAAIVFCISVVTLPMMIDRDVDLATAMMTSLVIVRENPRAMAVWAASIAGLTLLGMLTLFIGFMFVFPVLGHATWHAYRSLVDDSRPA